ncbi:MAG TPA: helix-turn-helix domain-containing protein [Pseudolysinimonas sp.]|nr:helix-turn-helix domain-containing protein [Pseudolysinimonas sp.]
MTYAVNPPRVRPSRSKLTAKERLLMEREYITIEQLAAMIHVSVATVYGWNYTGYGPRVSKFGHLVRFLANDVEDWLEARSDAA